MDTPFYATLFPSEFQQWFPMTLERKIQELFDKSCSSNSTSLLAPDPYDMSQIQPGDILLAIATPGTNIYYDCVRRSTNSIVDVALVINTYPSISILHISDLDKRFLLYPTYKENLKLTQPFSEWTDQFDGRILVKPLSLDSEHQSRIAPAISFLETKYLNLDPEKILFFLNAIICAEFLEQLGFSLSINPLEAVPGHFSKIIPALSPLYLLNSFKPLPKETRKVPMYEILQDLTLIHRPSLNELGIVEAYAIQNDSGETLLIVYVPKSVLNEQDPAGLILSTKIKDIFSYTGIDFSISLEVLKD